MSENKYSKVLTIILIIIIIAVVILLGFLGYDIYKKFSTKNSAEKAVDDFLDYVSQDSNNTNQDGNIVLPMLNESLVETNNSNGKKKVMYEGYNVVGTIEIPKISLRYPILERVTKESIEKSVAVLQPSAGPNKVGNTTIVGHNYRNGSFFGSNDRLALGDKIYITDTDKNKIKYNIYNIYTTTPDDADYMTRDTNGKREVSLSTCTDNSKDRLVIWAVEE